MKAVLEVIGGSMDGMEIAISSTTQLGRDKSCDVFLPEDRYISKRHAVLHASKDGYLLEDLGSTNGTYIDEEPVTKPILLTSSQIFKVGKTSLVIDYD